MNSTNTMVSEKAQIGAFVQRIHRVINYPFDVLFISPINIRYSDGRYVLMVAIFKHGPEFINRRLIHLHLDCNLSPAVSILSTLWRFWR